MNSDDLQPGTVPSEAVLLAEYGEVNEWWRQITQNRRNDIAGFTLIEGGIITILGDDLLSLSLAQIYLVLIGLLVAIIGFNDERRLYASRDGLQARALSIESILQISLARTTTRRVSETTFLVRNSMLFRIYYIMIGVGWSLVLLVNA